MSEPTSYLRPEDPNTIGLTFPEHIGNLQKAFPQATGELSGVMGEIMLAGKIISSKVRRAGLVHEMGLTGRINVQGEQVQYLDEFSNETILRMLGTSGHVCVMASEENTGPVAVAPGYPNGKYVVTIDPLDGSTNVDVNVSTGTIFSVHKRITPSGPGTLEDLLQPGHRQVAAGYILYGSSTIMVYAARGCGVYGFTLDPTIGEFLLSHPNIRIPQQSAVYSVNEGNTASWFERDRALIRILRDGRGPGGFPLTSRYVGSLVADFHRNLIRGGIFCYPGTPLKPNGKLRLLYECAPLAFVVEAAGGMATNGPDRILDLIPTDLHQRVPLYIGSRAEVEYVVEIFRQD